MEIKKYIYPLRRWWWLLAAATLVAALSSFLVTLQQPPIYMAQTTLMMGRAIDDPNPAANQFWLGQQLAVTYADIANREIVRNATMEALGISWLPAYKARALNNSQLIEISVTDTNPQRAQIIANELARQLALQTPTSVEPEEQGRQEFINQQLNTLEAQIKQTEADIAQLQGELGNLVSAGQIRDTQNQIAALQSKHGTLQANYGTLLSNTQRGAINTLTVIEPAGLPLRPIGPDKATAVVVAGMIGFVLASGAAYLLEYLDQTLKTPEDIKRIIGVPIIGYVAAMENNSAQQPYVANHPRHPVAEAFRSLRASLEFAAVDRSLKTLLVTSADTQEGKTSVASNMALVMAQSGKKVVLVDTDLRKPNLHEFFGISNEYGLSDLFRGRMALQNVMRIWQKDERVAVITAGMEPPNPAELLGSKSMSQILASLVEVSDIVILDGPPAVVTDAAMLASKVDGTILVVRPGFTHQAAAEAMMEKVKRSGANILGVVINRIPRKLADYYAGQLHLPPYYTAGSTYFETESTNGSGSVKKWQRIAEENLPGVLRGFKPRSK